MNEPIPCYVVRDLLPQHAEGLLSPESEEQVQAHLAGCAQCRELFRAMTSPEPEQTGDLAEVNFLKNTLGSSRGGRLQDGGTWASVFRIQFNI